MSNYRLQGDIKIGKGKYTVSVPVVYFQEDENTHILYAPTLDITGYGNNHEEAKASLKIATEEFFRYTHNKKTLDTVLTNLGWVIKGKLTARKFKSPLLTDIASKDTLYSEILNTKPHRVYSENMELAY